MNMEDVKKYIEDGISRHCASSVSAGIILKDGTTYSVAVGSHTYDPASPKTQITDLYDLASCTKVVFITLLIMKLYEDGLLDLDRPLLDFLPDFKNIVCPDDWRGKITTRNLMTHTAGLLATVPGSNFPMGSTMEYRREMIMKSVLKYEPGTATVYSDVGYMFLYIVIETIANEKPEILMKKWFYDEMGMVDTCFCPFLDGKKARCIPTERSDDAKPDEFLQSLVHDQKARQVGGIDGHAGLFSTIPDLLKFVDLMLHKGTYNGKQYLKPETIELFTKRANIDPKSTYCLGFDMMTTSGGEYTSPLAFGHIGFTGTCICVDPQHEIATVFLTNAVHPTRESKKDNGFFPFRDGFGTLVYKLLGLTSTYHPKPVVAA